MKPGDLVRMKEWRHFEQWWGMTAIICGTSITDERQSLVDICWLELDEIRLGMSASLFEIISEALD
jgi:hypothetical protein